MATASTVRKPGRIGRWFGTRVPAQSALYAAIVTIAREREWYAELGVPDSIDGRFDMVTLVLALVLLRLEGERREVESVRLTERFVDDMDGQIRESGFGDLVVGKQVGGIMALLGGRLGAYRQGLDAETLTRTLWRGNPPPPPVVAAAAARAVGLRDRLQATPVVELLAGQIA